MGADTTPANVVEAPPLKPISMTSKLSPAPKEAPKYAVTVKTSSGESIEVGDPNVTRALVALMDVSSTIFTLLDRTARNFLVLILSQELGILT